MLTFVLFLIVFLPDVVDSSRSPGQNAASKKRSIDDGVFEFVILCITRHIDSNIHFYFTLCYISFASVDGVEDRSNAIKKKRKVAFYPAVKEVRTNSLQLIFQCVHEYLIFKLCSIFFSTNSRLSTRKKLP